MKSICVFCASSPGANPAFRDLAASLGTEIARRGMELVYGGGIVGLMGIVADAALAAGGKVTGVIPSGLMEKERGHRGLTRLEVVKSMHERKARLAELSDAFIALPGGYGTFEEFCEAVTWAQLGLHQKPCCLVNAAGFYDSLLALFDRAVADGFLKPANRGLVITAKTVDEAFIAIAGYQPLSVKKWLTPPTT